MSLPEESGPQRLGAHESEIGRSLTLDRPRAPRGRRASAVRKPTAMHVATQRGSAEAPPALVAAQEEGSVPAAEGAAPYDPSDDPASEDVGSPAAAEGAVPPQAAAVPPVRIGLEKEPSRDGQAPATTKEAGGEADAAILQAESKAGSWEQAAAAAAPPVRIGLACEVLPDGGVRLDMSLGFADGVTLTQRGVVPTEADRETGESPAAASSPRLAAPVLRTSALVPRPISPSQGSLQLQMKPRAALPEPRLALANQAEWRPLAGQGALCFHRRRPRAGRLARYPRATSAGRHPVRRLTRRAGPASPTSPSRWCWARSQQSLPPRPRMLASSLGSSRAEARRKMPCPRSGRQKPHRPRHRPLS